MDWDLIVVILIMAAAVIVAIGIKVVLVLLAKNGIRHFRKKDDDKRR